jgi:ferredoxin
MAKIIQNHEGCIGCGSCVAVCPKFWEMNYEEAKADLKGAKKNEKGEQVLEVKEVECNKEAADVCPVNIIKIE